MKIAFNLAENDYKSFYNYHYSQYKIMKLRPYYGTLMIIMGGLHIIWIKNIKVLSLLLILFGVYFIISKLFYIRRAINASRTNPSFPNNIEIDIDDEGIMWKGKDSHGSFQWSSLIGYREFDKGFLLYRQRNLFNMIPTGQLNDEDRRKLSSLFKDKLKKL